MSDWTIDGVKQDMSLFGMIRTLAETTKGTIVFWQR